MTDIVARLRKYPKPERCNNIFRKTSENAHEAADEIERLRVALREIADHTTNPEGSGPAYRMVGNLVRTARAALEERT